MENVGYSRFNLGNGQITTGSKGRFLAPCGRGFLPLVLDLLQIRAHLF